MGDDFSTVERMNWLAYVQQHSGKGQAERRERALWHTPKPVIVTAQGPLFDFHAIEQWLATRSSKRQPARA